MVIPCVGETVDRQGLERLLDGASYLSSDAEGRLNSDTPLFAGGDARGDRGTVAAAIGDGRIAAAAIIREHSHRAAERETPSTEIGPDRLNLNYYEPMPRHPVPILPPAQRTDETEIEGGYETSAFHGEIARCFSCGNCLACDNCWNLCPDNAVIKTGETAADGSHYVFDYEFCKGCGLCAHECPCGYIEMIPEPD